MVFVVLVVLWFSGSSCSCGSTPLVLVLWLPCSTSSHIFSDGTTCGNVGVRDGMRAKSEQMELGDERDTNNYKK